MGGNRGGSGGDRTGREAALGAADSLGYRRPLPEFSTNDRRLSANDPAAQRFFPRVGLTGGMDRTIADEDTDAPSDWSLALKSIAGIWLLYMVLVTLRSAVLPYPGFVAGPYMEYSQPWFGTHKVLRGGCLVTRARLIHNGWRNFYEPHRRDVLAGFRTVAGSSKA